MKCKWSEEEKAVLLEHFETAPSIYDLAPMLPGRDYTTIRKKANSMGLHRPDLKDLSHAKLLAVLSDSPMSVREIAEQLGYKPNSVNFLLQRAHSEDLCHVCGHLPSRGPGKNQALWIKGPGENVESEFEIASARREEEAKRRRAEELSRPAFRDPFVALFYGAAA